LSSLIHFSLKHPRSGLIVWRGLGIGGQETHRREWRGVGFVSCPLAMDGASFGVVCVDSAAATSALHRRSGRCNGSILWASKVRQGIKAGSGNGMRRAPRLIKPFCSSVVQALFEAMAASKQSYLANCVCNPFGTNIHLTLKIEELNTAQ
jgi:hypothetical protein